MSALNSGLRAFGGGPLEGNAWVRVLYLDEAGVGNLQADPILVVAGVMIHADTQWAAISRRLQEILQEGTPPSRPVPSHLHATDIFHGSGNFPREHWSKDVRHGMLDRIARIPAEFDIPVVWSALDRKAFAKTTNDNMLDQTRDLYSVAAFTCFVQSEQYLRELENQSEVTSIILEQNTELQKRIPEMMDLARHPEKHPELNPEAVKYLPFKKIIDSPAIQAKSASNILQLADYCAFAIKRHYQKSNNSTKLVSPFASQLMMYRGSDLSMKDGLWDPKFMPRIWGNNVFFENGRFVRKG